MRAGLLAASFALVACGGPAAAPSPDAGDDAWRAVSGAAFGAGWKVQWREVGGAGVDPVQEAVVAALEDVDLHLSTWRDDSELAAVRRGPGPVPVSEETAHVVRRALELAALTGGAFDPTVQPLMELWGLAGEPRTTWPSPEELAAARGLVGWTRVEVGRGADGRPTVDAGGTALDVSAIAPGHAADRVAWTLAGLGVSDFYADVGGEIRVGGHSPRGGPWRVGVEAPDPDAAPGSTLIARVDVVDGAVATSGNYRTRYELDGRVVHHTMDPRTGEPSTARVLSATVLAPDAATADGWATALMVLGEEGLALVEAQPLVEAWLVVEGAQGMEARGTRGLGARLQPSASVGGSARPE